MSTNQTSSGGGQRRWLLWTGLAVVTIVVGGVVGGLAGSATSSNSACDATAVADQTLPTVVTISVRKSLAGSTGTGEIIRSDGYILTNNHVISLAAEGGKRLGELPLFEERRGQNFGGDDRPLSAPSVKTYFHHL